MIHYRSINIFFSCGNSKLLSIFANVNHGLYKPRFTFKQNIAWHMKFYDRENEIRILQENEKKSAEHASFMVLMGRRRVGKTTLIMKALEGKDYAYLFVSRDSEAMLCQKFQNQLEQHLGIHVYGTMSTFRDLFEMIMRESTHRHFTIIIDEFQGLYRCNPAIFSEMQDIWDRYHQQSKINLIACGSIHSLMKRIFENQSEPLYGRPTSKMTLRPFSIAIMKEMLSDVRPDYSAEDLLCMYLITGGVAKYLELLIDGGYTTKTDILNAVCRQDSYFLSEGHDLLVNEFQGEYSTYFSILQLIASGYTRRSEIDGKLQKDTGTYLRNLDENYEMIAKLQPILSKAGGKTSIYEVKDHFLRFWLRFIYPYQTLIETNQLPLLRQHIEDNYTQFSGRTLELYFQQKLMETGRFTRIGNWWDRSGKNEIDIVALNEFNHTGIIGEVKRNRDRIDMPLLKEKASHIPASLIGHYAISYQPFSMDDM